METIQLLTKADLEEFKEALLQEIKRAVRPEGIQSKQWLKSQDVRKLLNISPGTLQNLRINGTLQFTKIGGIFYYKSQDITKILEGHGTV